jgi:rhamnosyltransferase
VISVVIPVKDGGSDLVRCLEAIRSQKLEDEVEVVVVDSGSTDGSPERARSFGAHVHEIPPKEFGHGHARNLGAGHAQGDVLVFTSQDAYAADDSWLASLVASFATEPDVAGVYGRQIAHLDAAPPEHYFLDFMFGPDPQVQRAESPDDISIATTHFSNVNSAIPRALWGEHPFADDLIMSEDQEWSRRMLLAGYTIRYEPRAAVRHSHDYSIPGAFRRFFDSGVSAERSFVGERPSSSAVLRREGVRYARGEISWLWRTGKRRWIPYTAVYELAKFAGLQLGRRHRFLPHAVNRRVSELKNYWDDDAR